MSRRPLTSLIQKLMSSDACNDGVCNETSDVCEAAPVATPESSAGANNLAAREDFIPLNTRGYNYSRPGTFRPENPPTVAPAEP